MFNWLKFWGFVDVCVSDFWASTESAIADELQSSVEWEIEEFRHVRGIKLISEVWEFCGQWLEILMRMTRITIIGRILLGNFAHLLAIFV